MSESSPNTEPQLLLESGPMLLRDFNPKGVLYWTGRKCLTCGGEIMDHWLKYSDSAELKGLYWCAKDGAGYSEGIADCEYDVKNVQAPKE